MGLCNWFQAGWRTKSLGERGEDVAARFLKRKNYRILARHHDAPLGEIDIIAVDGRTIVFVEVKTRKTADAGHPAEAIDKRKQRRLTQSALAYLKAQRLLNYSARFDVVAVLWPDDLRDPTIEHTSNAFAPVGDGQFFG